MYNIRVTTEDGVEKYNENVENIMMLAGVEGGHLMELLMNVSLKDMASMIHCSKNVKKAAKICRGVEALMAAEEEEDATEERLIDQIKGGLQ